MVPFLPTNHICVQKGCTIVIEEHPDIAIRRSWLWHNPPSEARRLFEHRFYYDDYENSPYRWLENIHEYEAEDD